MAEAGAKVEAVVDPLKPPGDTETVDVPVSGREGQTDQSEGRDDKRIQRLINLQRDVTTSVTNIQTTADAKFLQRQAEVEEAQRIWRVRLENDAKSSREKFQEITNRWELVKETMIPQELQKTMDSQEQRYAAIIEEKKKLISDLQRVLKNNDNSYVDILKKNAEEIGLMEETMKDGISTLTKAYREELAVTETSQMQELKSLFSEKSKLDNDLVKLCEEEAERLRNREQTVKEYEVQINKKIWEYFNTLNVTKMESLAETQVLQRKKQQFVELRLMSELSLMEEEYQEQIYNTRQVVIEREVLSLQAEASKLAAKKKAKTEALAKRCQHLTEEHKHCLQHYEGLLKKVKRLKNAEAHKVERVWHTTDTEVKLQVERALRIDSLIWRNHLGVAWKRPSIAASALAQPQDVVPNVAQPTERQHSRGIMEASAGPLLDTDSEPELYEEEGGMSMEAQKSVIELFCDEAGFLLEDKLLKLLDHLGEEEASSAKLHLLLCELGIKAEDVPKLIYFLWMYGKPTEDDDAPCDRAETAVSQGGIQPNNILPALKSFLEQHRRLWSTSPQTISQHRGIPNTSGEDTYWERLPDIISEDKLKLLVAPENLFLKYLESLTEITNLVAETEIEKQLNTELRTLLHQRYMEMTEMLGPGSLTI